MARETVCAERVASLAAALTLAVPFDSRCDAPRRLTRGMRRPMTPALSRQWQQRARQVPPSMRCPTAEVSRTADLLTAPRGCLGRNTKVKRPVWTGLRAGRRGSRGSCFFDRSQAHERLRMEVASRDGTLTPAWPGPRAISRSPATGASPPALTPALRRSAAVPVSSGSVPTSSESTSGGCPLTARADRCPTVPVVASVKVRRCCSRAVAPCGGS
jgi:hypothetical protein